ncbi:hypothetical protein [Mesorhizobium sp. M0129]|uniref:hypothetical protein n=1 Tax=Mesorhizobium sp. M0129 TaxID=2956886 RepID=UPI00333A2C7E
MAWHRVLAKDKLAFREDLQSDPTLTDLQKRMISTIVTHWDNERMAAECSESFIAKGAGTTAKMVKRYKASLVDSGRVSIKRAATYTESTLWDVNWRFRGSAWVRINNDGQPMRSCGVVPNDAQAVVPVDAQGWSPTSTGGGPQAGTQFPSQKKDISAPVERPLWGGRRGARENENPNKVEPGFARWKIIHAEYTGQDEDTFVAHMRSGKNRKFVLRSDIDSDDYASINAALDVDGDADNVIGSMVQMSTNPSGPKTFMRAAPLPWSDVTILEGEEREDGGANIRIRFNDGDGGEATLKLAADNAATMIAECGGETEAIGARIMYRLHPNDKIEFRRISSG